jgi:hypothetical protein
MREIQDIEDVIAAMKRENIEMSSVKFYFSKDLAARVFVGLGVVDFVSGMNGEIAGVQTEVIDGIKSYVTYYGNIMYELMI